MIGLKFILKCAGRKENKRKSKEMREEGGTEDLIRSIKYKEETIRKTLVNEGRRHLFLRRGGLIEGFDGKTDL